MVNFGATTAALDLRHTSTGDRYDVALLANGHLQIRRNNGSVVTVLGDVPSGIGDLSNWSTIALSATGAGPVQLVASVDGVAKVSAVDTSAAAITTAGTAGLWTNLSGVLFDDFTVTGMSSGGAVDAGTPDAGTPDAGTPDAGTPDAGTPDAGTPDAGTPDAGSPDGGTPGTVIFADDFQRTLCCDLGPNWLIPVGGWRDNNKANSDRSGLDRAVVAGVSCADCGIDARMVNFGGGEAMLELRGAGGDRYALALRADGVLEIRRYRGGASTVLANAPSGVPDIANWSSFTFVVQGVSPVVLTGSVNGVVKVAAQDSGSLALTGSGTAGLAAIQSGILFDSFKLTAR